MSARPAKARDRSTPVARPSKIRASRMGKWRALVLIGVHVIIGLHIAHWLSSGETVTPVEPSEAMAFSRSSIVNAGLIFFAVMILLTAVFGRFFCGWGCHVVALQDLCRHWMLKIGITPRPLKSRFLLWVPTLAFLYMFIWPAVYRLWLGDSLAVRGVEMTTAHFWSTFPGWVVGILTLLICGFACVYFLGAKGFCTYACPYGAIFAAADRVAPMRIRVTDACNQCGHCTAVCSSNVRVHEEVRDWAMVVSAGCMKCQDCVSVCPTNALYYGIGPIPLLAKPRVELAAKPPQPIRWRDELILVSAFVISFLIARGLYGVVPFLMSLGLAGVVAFLTLTTVRLFGELTLERPGLRLKRDGRLLPQGRWFAVAMSVLALLLAHSAYIRAQAYLGARAYSATAPLRITVLEEPGTQLTPSAERRATIDAGIRHLGRVDAWGLFPSLGNAAMLAWLQTLAGAEDAAAAQAQQALSRDELPEQMHQLLAHLALVRGDQIRAVEHWQQAIEARPDLAGGYLALGLHYAKAGDIAAAQQVFDRGVARATANPSLYYNAALARAIQGQIPQAIPLFEEALVLDPHYREARENLAGVLASQGDFAAAIAHYRIALQQAPQDVQTRLLLARALVGAGDYPAARKELQAILELDMTNGDARAMLDAIAGSVRP